MLSTTAAAVALIAPAKPKPAARVEPPDIAAVSSHNNALNKTTKTTLGLNANVTPKSNESLAARRILC